MWGGVLGLAAAALVMCHGEAWGEDTKPVTTLDIREYLLSHSPWVNPEGTVDTVKIGDATRPVRKAGVCWYPSIETIRKAAEEGCDLLICHEPTFWEHAAPETRWRGQVPGIAKRELLEKTGLVILRAHDTWDQWPEIGIRDSWARWLGFEKRVYASKGNNYHAVFDLAPRTLRELAQYIADKIKPLGEDSVQVIGDPDRIVSKPAIGVGCAVPDKECVEAGADALIVCYDGAYYWAHRERLHEMGAAVITVEHGTSEMPGMESLCKHLAERYPSIRFQYLAEHPRTWTVRGR
jgi:putative NIF3 family GTP cyclohydrolase 1 type 2